MEIFNLRIQYKNSAALFQNIINHQEKGKNGFKK